MIRDRSIGEFYSPFPKQKIFHASPAKYRLFGGAAGPGKTLALLMEAMLQAYAYPGVSTLLLRRTFPELEQSLIREFRKLPQSMYKSYNESRHMVTWHNGSTTQFGYCQSEADVYQYQGGEYLFIGFDELTMFTLRQWQYLTSRNRCPVKGSFPCMAGATNPGNEGHAWVKSLWVEHKPAVGMEKNEVRLYKASDYDFIPASLEDNPIYANDSEYKAKLDALPGWMAQAYREGSWDIFAGQYFDIFQKSEHVRHVTVEPWYTKWLSIDYGYDHSSTAHAHSRDEKGFIHTYGELKHKGQTPQQLGALIGAKFGRDKINKVYADPYCFAKRESDHTIADQIGEVLASFGMPRPLRADNDRPGGWMLMYQMLQNGVWTISPDCPDLIEQFGVICRDPETLGDCLKYDGDDSMDDVRYGLKTHCGTARVPVEIEFQRKAETFSSDPTIRNMQSMKFFGDKAKSRGTVKIVRPRSFRQRAQEARYAR